MEYESFKAVFKLMSTASLEAMLDALNTEIQRNNRELVWELQAALENELVRRGPERL